jgi:hypothetical protein
MPHAQNNKQRLCKGRRQQCHKLLALLKTSDSKDSEVFQDTVKTLTAKSSYMRNVARRCLDNGANAPAESSTTGGRPAASTTTPSESSKRRNIMAL